MQDVTALPDDDPTLQLLPVRRHRQLAVRWTIVACVAFAVQVAVGLTFGEPSFPLMLIQGGWILPAAVAYGHNTEARGYVLGVNARWDREARKWVTRG